ncbi:MAG: HD domain-containing protein [Bacteroidetes bacterium]|nr:HD domain-containing protein [Bacteroidota bacterium]
MDYSKLEKDAEDYIRTIFRTSPSPELPYHNQEHTIRVVGHAREIGDYYLLQDENRFIITIAAWFHDIGQLSGPMEGHEQRGAQLMKDYFSGTPLSERVIASITDCILATRFPSHPQTLCEQILCDADTYHFGTEYFRQTDGAVKKEMELRTGTTFPHWRQKTIHFLEIHRYFTAYCQQLLNAGKQKNLEWLRSLPD